MANLASILKKSCMDSGECIVIDDETLKLIQKKLLMIMEDIISVCQENGIDYQLSGGTALGAVRHHGFIPWDDDIDLNMRRCELERFLPLFREKFGDKYWICVPGETADYDQMMVHIMLKNVRARKLMEKNVEQCGLCIDIFPVENTYNDPVRRYIHGMGCMWFRYVMSCLRFLSNADEVLRFGKFNKELERYAKKRIHMAKFFTVIPQKKWFRWNANWMKQCKNEKSKYVVIPSGQHQFFREMYERAWFCASVCMTFEGRVVNVTEGYVQYLTILYGNNYMEIPPESKHERHVMLEMEMENLK